MKASRFVKPTRDSIKQERMEEVSHDLIAESEHLELHNERFLRSHSADPRSSNRDPAGSSSVAVVSADVLNCGLDGFRNPELFLKDRVDDASLASSGEHTASGLRNRCVRGHSSLELPRMVGDGVRGERVASDIGRVFVLEIQWKCSAALCSA